MIRKVIVLHVIHEGGMLANKRPHKNIRSRDDHGITKHRKRTSFYFQIVYCLYEMKYDGLRILKCS